MDPYPSPQEASAPFQQFQQHSGETGHKQRKQRPKFLNRRHSYNNQFNPEKIEHSGAPRKAPGPHSCFNCGSPEHWAQECPEPRKTVPNAADGNPRPSKRQKTGGPVVTRYPVPAHIKQQHGMPRLYTQAQTGYMPYGSYPPTPVSAHSQTSSPWQQCPPYPSPVQSYPPYGSFGLSTPTASNSSQFPSPVSGHNNQQYQGYFPPQPQQLPYSNDQQSPGQGFSHYSSTDPNSGMPQNYQSHRDDVPHAARPSGPWTEGMQSSDGWSTSKSSGGQIIWRPANPVARPLPAMFSSHEEALPLPPLTTLQPGMSVSKYILDKGPEEFECHIRDTEEWPLVMDDPIFREIRMDCPLISLKELISRRKEIYRTHNIKVINEAEEGEIAEDASHHNADLVNDGPENIKHEKLEINNKDNEKSHNMESSEKHTEGILKINRNRKRPFDEIESLGPDGGDENSGLNRDRSHERKYSQSHRNNAWNDNSDRTLRRNNQSNSSGHRHSKRGNDVLTHSNRDRHTISHQGSSLNRASQQRKRPRGPYSSTGHNESLEKREQKIRRSDIATNMHHEDGEPKPKSPTQSWSEQNSRKRSHLDNSPESDNDGPRRQEDDVPSKSKRKQPQISSAYSRRW